MFKKKRGGVQKKLTKLKKLWMKQVDCATYPIVLFCMKSEAPPPPPPQKKRKIQLLFKNPPT